jgi:hypothetical protein
MRPALSAAARGNPDLLSFVDFSAVTNAEHDDVVTLYVEYHAIIANAETVSAKLRIRQRFGVLGRIVFEPKESGADAFFNTSVKPVNISDGFMSIYQSAIQYPNTSSCVLTRPAL